MRQKVFTFSLIKKREIGFWRDLAIWGCQGVVSLGSGGLRACRVRDGVRVKDNVKREARRGWGELGWWRGVQPWPWHLKYTASGTDPRT